MGTHTQFEALSASGIINTLRPGEQKPEEQGLLGSICITHHFLPMGGKEERADFRGVLGTQVCVWGDSE